MSAPPRWKERPDMAPVGVAELLTAARPTRGMTGLEHAKLGTKIAVAGGGSKLLANGTLLSLSVKTATIFAPAMAVVTVASVTPSVVQHWRMQRKEAIAVAVSQPTAPTRENEEPPPPPIDDANLRQMEAPVLEGRLESARPTAAPIAQPKRRSSPNPATGNEGMPVVPLSPPASDLLVREAEVLADAKAELRRAPAEALRILSEHAYEFPEGQLRGERELLAIEALVRLGRYEEAKARRASLIGTSNIPPIYRDRTKALGE